MRDMGNRKGTPLPCGIRDITQKRQPYTFVRLPYLD